VDPDADVADCVFHRLDATEVEPGGAPRRALRHAAGDVAVAQRVLGRAQLLVELALDRGPLEQVTEQVRDAGFHWHGVRIRG
jgi:hypothetical protein